MKRFLLYLSALFVGVSFATAQTYEIGVSTGTLTNGNGTTKSSVWTSSELAGFTLTSTCNGAAVDMMNVNSGLLQLYANYNGSDVTYTINAPEGCSIKEYTIKYKKGSSSYGITITAENGVTQTPAKTTAEQTFEVEGLSGASTVFTLEGTTNMKDFIKITSFIVTLQKVEEGGEEPGEGGEEPGDGSTVEEQYAAIAKPSFAKAGNTTFVKAATLTGGVETEVAGIQPGAGQACVTNAIDVEKGAQFNLNITYQLNWGDLSIYQIENDEATKEYGYYIGSWEPNGSTAKVVQYIVEDEIAVSEVVDDVCTVTFPISISDAHNPGDIVVVRAITGVKNDATNSAYEQGIAEGGYVDFLFVVTEANEPESYTLSVGETKWATMFLDFAATIPADVEAYTVTKVNDGYVILTQVIGVLPANTGVVVKADEGDYTFAYSAEEAADVTGNFLKGTVTATEINEEAYVLGIVDGKVGLYKAEMSGGVWLNNANKAYLPASVVPNKSAQFYGFDWDGTTGVEEVKGENVEVKAIFDLTGRRVKEITAPGIYIVNGRRVFVK